MLLLATQKSYFSSKELLEVCKQWETLQFQGAEHLHMVLRTLPQAHTIPTPMLHWENVHTIQSVIDKAKVSKIPIPKALRKLRQTPIFPNLPSPMEILHNRPAGPHIPGQQVPTPRDLQRICEAHISHHQQQKWAEDIRKNAKAPRSTYRPRCFVPNGPRCLAFSINHPNWPGIQS